MAQIWIDVDTAVTVPVNLYPLTDDTDFKSRETAVAYNAAGMDLVWNFITCAGAYSQTAVTPTTSGDYDWTHNGDAMYKIEIPASGGASINNNTEGFGWFTGVATGVLPWAGPIIGFRTAALNDALIEGGDNLDVNVVQNAGSAITSASGIQEVKVASIANAAIAAAAFAANAIAAASIAADVTTELWSGVTDSAGVTTLLARLSATRAAFLDNLDNAELANVPAFPANFGSLAITATGKVSPTDIYFADIELTIDEANTQDEYTVGWFKNGAPVTSGITDPEIQVVKRADGSDLIAGETMTQIGTTGAYKYDAAGAERITAGEAVRVIATATIDGATRTWAKNRTRDST